MRRADPEHRVIAVGAGPVSLVVLDEGSDAGWRATAGGHLLREVTVDRWRQAFVLPAGGPTVVDISFAPGHWHRVGLAAGLVAMTVLVGLLLGLLLVRRRDDLPPSGPGQPRAATATVVVLVVGGVLAGLPGLALAVAAVTVIRWRRVALSLATMLYAVAAVAAARSSELSGGRTASLAAVGGLLIVLAGALDAGLGHLARRRRNRSAPPLEQGSFEHVP